MTKVRFRLACVAVLAVAGAGGALSTTEARGQAPTTYTCPLASTVKVTGPTGWSGHNPTAFASVATTGGKTGIACNYVMTGQDVKVRISRVCPSGQKSAITGPNTATCAP